MKILFIHHSGLIGGAGVSLINTIEALKIEGNDIILTLPSEPSDMQRLAEKNGIIPIITERRIGAVTCVSGIDAFLSPRFMYRSMLILQQFWKWDKRITEINPDLVIMNSKTLCWMSHLPAVKNRKSICFVRETMRGKRNALYNRMISRCLDAFSKVVFLSEYDKKIENLEKPKTEVIHNYIADMPPTEKEDLLVREKEWGLVKGRFRILYVGGVSEMKGFHVAVQATLGMGQDAELIAAGSNISDIMQMGNRKAMKFAFRMKKYLDENDKLNQIHLIGKQQEMALCYELCDVLIFPMQSPHQARPAFEAGYFGKPVVISDFENIHEFVRDGYNGFTVDSSSVKEFTDRLTELKENMELRKLMGQNNAAMTKQRHSQSAVQQQIKEMISGNWS